MTLTLDPEGDGVAESRVERVGGGARVPPHLLPPNTLQHQRICRQYDAATHVLYQRRSLEKEEKKTERNEQSYTINIENCILSHQYMVRTPT